MDILEIVRQRKEELQQQFGIERIGLVTPPTADDPQDHTSVNLVIEFREITINGFLGLKSFLEKLFGKDVDLAVFEESPPRIRPLTEDQIQWSG